MTWQVKTEDGRWIDSESSLADDERRRINEIVGFEIYREGKTDEHDQ